MCAIVGVCERQAVCVRICVREILCGCERFFMCVCVCEREREREREREKGHMRIKACVSETLGVGGCVC